MKNQLKDRISTIDNSLKRFLPIKNNYQKEIYNAMSYSLFAGGKRLRPILMWECAKLFGGSWSTVENFACAIEMIHTYSLIHDDLPAMDNDDLRRGLPTNHIKFGEDIAILAGDGLLNLAFETAIKTTSVSSDKILTAMNILATSGGTEGMIGGQVVDLMSEGETIDIDKLQYIHALKTGSLIRAACVIGAVLAGATDEETEIIDQYAYNLGIAFQIRDDILDVVGDVKELGKPIGSDDRSQKNTYIKICGLEKSKELLKDYSDKAIAEIKKIGDSTEFLVELTNYLITRTK